jgi:hypothetical protein
MVHPKEPESFSRWKARRLFFRAAVERYPEIVQSLRSQILPLVVEDEKPKGVRRRLQSELRDWGQPFGLVDDWALSIAAHSVVYWKRSPRYTDLDFPDLPEARRPDFEVTMHGYDPSSETADEFRAGALSEFHYQLNSYVKSVISDAWYHGWIPEPRRLRVTKNDRGLRWLAEVHCDPRRDASARQIAKREKVAYRTVAHALKVAEDKVGLSIRRRGRPGRRKKS